MKILKEDQNFKGIIVNYFKNLVRVIPLRDVTFSSFEMEIAHCENVSKSSHGLKNEFLSSFSNSWSNFKILFINSSSRLRARFWSNLAYCFTHKNIRKKRKQIKRCQQIKSINNFKWRARYYELLCYMQTLDMTNNLIF